jgi:IS605 OrfB family transposase
LASHGKQLVFAVHFEYGQQAILDALGSSRRISAKTRSGKPTVKRIGTALSYRFVRDDKGWRVFVSAQASPVPVTSRRDLGAIGVDVNADHLAVAETDRFGNLIQAQRLDCRTYGISSDQAKALIGDVCVALAAQAKAAEKPLVIERLNFQKKKSELEGVDPRQARMLSSFVCAKVACGLKAAAFRAGVEVIEVNPAYTSVIGAVNHAQQRGISVHQGAAFAIARRGLGLSERPAVREAIVPIRNGDHVTFDLPVRNRSKHVWSFWSKVRTRLTAAHVAHFRSGAAKAAPAPLRQSNPASCSIWISTARFRGANRSQHCSGSVMEDVPW